MIVKSGDMASDKTLKVLQVTVEFELYPESNRESQKHSKSDLILKYPFENGGWNERERVHSRRPPRRLVTVVQWEIVLTRIRGEDGKMWMHFRDLEEGM